MCKNIFTDECFASGFKINMGTWLKAAFSGVDIEKPESIKTVIAAIDDIEFFGSAFFYAGIGNAN